MSKKEAGKRRSKETIPSSTEICAPISVDKGVTQEFIHSVLAIKFNLDSRKIVDDVALANSFDILVITILPLNLQNTLHLNVLLLFKGHELHLLKDIYDFNSLSHNFLFKGVGGGAGFLILLFQVPLYIDTF